ncbi:hypothetical protein [Paenibacillus sp. FSL R7-0337]|uniref:hypothetical protein n=1 Tax=Paenibacillus sp. FSL R7-0337 TaxID=1926588 RepID=UPI00096FF987|nr:hypothetical protein [Paenibacillus sp. FSL R7-0337]OMF86670.1 hypothetical protein BK147_29785 [Paenibacillus sp. FSL R7-0337]
MSRKISLVALTFIFMLFTFACSSTSRNNGLVESLQETYFENDQVAGFLNTFTNQIDITTTYYSFEINQFFGNLIKIDEEKLKLVVLSKILYMTEEKNLTRSLAEEKNTISLAEELKVQLDSDLKNKINNSLEEHLKNELKQTPESDQTTININHQYKLQIHYNYLFINKILNMKISPPIMNLIEDNLIKVENNLTQIEQKSMKAIYYTYFIKKWLEIPINEKDIVEKLNQLRLADGSYLFLPVKEQKKIEINGSEYGDIFSTSFANEVLIDINGINNSKSTEKTLEFIDNYLKKNNKSNYENSNLYINDLYEVIHLAKIMEYNE